MPPASEIHIATIYLATCLPRSLSVLTDLVQSESSLIYPGLHLIQTAHELDVTRPIAHACKSQYDLVVIGAGQGGLPAAHLTIRLTCTAILLLLS